MSIFKVHFAEKKLKPLPIHQRVQRFFVLGIASGLGLGYIPFASGTFGSLLGIPLGFLLLKLDLGVAAMLCLAVGLYCSPICERAAKHWGNADDGHIVIDEVLGMAIAMLGLTPVYVRNPDDILVVGSSVFVCFLFFRFFDIVKPFPARLFDHRNDGFGVMADDMIAGLYAAIFIWGLITALLPG